MTSAQLFPKPPKRMKQPSKDVLRDQLVQAAEEIERLRAETLRMQDRISSASAALTGEMA